ncbi:MAG: DNA translocase FtsK [Planctomycetota bacterium]|nr:DNA translocase FtsK [Planctomycetota bacterium]
MNYQRLKTDLMGLCLFAATVFVSLSLFSYDPADPPSTLVAPQNIAATNLCGQAGAYAAHALRFTFGVGSFVFVMGMLFLSVRLFYRSDKWGPLWEGLGWGLSIAAACVSLQILVPAWGDNLLIGSGGYLGVGGKLLLEEHVSAQGTMILLAATLGAGFLLTIDSPLWRCTWWGATTPFWIVSHLAFGSLSAGTTTKKPSTKKIKEPDLLEQIMAGELPASTSSGEAEDVEPELPRIPLVGDDELDEVDDELHNDEVAFDDSEEADEDELPLPVADKPKAIHVNPPRSAPSARDEIKSRLEAGSSLNPDCEYELPALDILEEAEEFPFELLAQKAQIAATTLEKTFQEFGLNVKVKEIDTGPVITLFELELEAGLRVSKVTALADDLAIALRVPAVRVVSPIPGKNTVGVEVPNDKQVMVRLKELIESCPQSIDKMRIPVFLGKDVSGRPLAVDLAKMPHLLIAGRTGTGKSVCLNTLILSMLMTRSPDDVRMLMIDPKMVELSPYKRIPHLMHPVITDMKKAEAVLAWAVDKMEERYDLLARSGVRHLDGYNKLGREAILEKMGVAPDDEEAERIPDHMPYIVIIADEMADMMMTSGKDVEGHIIRLAQKSRAVGIHLVLATQKPTVDVITGLIKSNLPARISFQVASRVDSRVVLDEMGADRLLGNGDMLYLAPGTSHLTRAQGTYVSDDEINGVIDSWSEYEPQYSTELAQVGTLRAGGSSGIDALRQRDEVYEQAIEVVIREGRGSVSLLQRALGIGYGRAARLVDYMAEDGIVGDYNGSQAREVLYTLEQWEELKLGEPVG